MLEAPNFQVGKLPSDGWYVIRYKGVEEGPLWCMPVESNEFGYFVTWGHDETDDPEVVKFLFDHVLEWDEEFDYMALEWRPTLRRQPLSTH